MEGRPMGSTTTAGATDRPRRALSVEASEAWLAWAARLARFAREPRSVSVDKGLALYAKQLGFPEEPPER